MTRSIRPLVLLAAMLAAAAPSFGAEKDAPAKGPLRVFILAGQSNMDGQANIATVDFLGEDKDPARAALLKKFKPDGKNWVTRSDVWVASGTVCGELAPGYGGRRDYSKLGNNIGPEYAFGYFMGEAFDEQVLLIKYGPGGQSLYANFRPPSAGPTGRPELDGVMLTKEVADQWNKGLIEPVVGLQYRTLLRYTRDTLANLKTHFPAYDEAAGYQIVGFVWFQGFNDQFDENARKQYGTNLVHLIKDMRKDLKAPDMKVVVGVMGVNGVNNEVGKQKDVRDGQRFVNTVPEFAGNVRAIETAPLLHPDVVAIRTAGWLHHDRDLKTQPITPEEEAMLRRATSDKGFHYFGEGRFFILLGKGFADTMLELLGKPGAPATHSPAVPQPK